MGTYIESDSGLALGGNGGNGSFFGGEGIWAILLFAMIFGGGWGGMGFGGGYGGALGYDFPWLLNGQNAINNNTNNGFRDAALTSGISNLQNAISTGFANAEVSRGNLAMALQNCCCENRAGLADLKYTVATENCADRQAISDGIRDVIASNTANTNAILSKLCQQEIDAKNDLISTLRSQLNMANLAASQTAQTADIRASQNATLSNLLTELRSCPIPAQPVYGSTPIFTCSNGGCGCNGGVGIQ